MKQITMKTILAVMAMGLISAAAFAEPVMLSDSQMDTVAAGGVEKVDGFVCPAIPGQGLAKTGNDRFFPIGEGYYSFHGPDVSVPVHATNADGAGRPGADFAVPGDTNYSAVWGFRP